MRPARPRRRLGGVASCAVAFALAVLCGTSPAGAQTSTPNALQGFSQNRDQPVKIDAATLEVRDKDKVATFSGDVHLVQGDTTMRCKTLVVFYDQDSSPGPASSAAPVAPGGNQSIKRIEAKGSVEVTQKDQRVTSEIGIFDMRANTVTLHNNVVISQGPNQVKGDRLVVNLTTGVSRVECNPNSQTCRVSALLSPKSGPPSDGSPGALGLVAPVAPAGAAVQPGRPAPAAKPGAATPRGLY